MRFKKVARMHQCAKEIQKIARGMLVRCSDRFLLAQIYMKLPPFWKTVIHSCAPEEGNIMANLGRFVASGDYHERVKKYHLDKATRDVRALIKGIESNRTVDPGIEYRASGAEKTLNISPKLPFIVPQSFDKKAYVGRSDGRKLAFFSDRVGLMRSDLVLASHTQSVYATKPALTFGLENYEKDSEAMRVHQYTFTFWPVVSRPIPESEGDTTLFDPSLNGFEVKDNMRKTLHCELCGIRLRLILCRVCTRGFCFFCAFKAHSDGAKRNHNMEMIEPRVVHVKHASTSLVYHLDMVQQTSYDIKYVLFHFLCDYIEFDIGIFE